MKGNTKYGAVKLAAVVLFAFIQCILSPTKGQEAWIGENLVVVFFSTSGVNWLMGIEDSLQRSPRIWMGIMKTRTTLLITNYKLHTWTETKIPPLQ